MSEKATLTIGSEHYELDVFTGSENETCIDIQKLRTQSGAITMDPGKVYYATPTGIGFCIPSSHPTIPLFQSIKPDQQASPSWRSRIRK